MEVLYQVLQSKNLLNSAFAWIYNPKVVTENRLSSIWIPERGAEVLSVDEYWKGIFENMVYLSRIKTGSPAGFPIVAKGFLIGEPHIPATAEFFPFDPFKFNMPTAGVINYEIDSVKGVLMANAVWNGSDASILARDGRPNAPQPTIRALHFVNGFINQEITDLMHAS